MLGLESSEHSNRLRRIKRRGPSDLPKWDASSGRTQLADSGQTPRACQHSGRFLVVLAVSGGYWEPGTYLSGGRR